MKKNKTERRKKGTKKKKKKKKEKTAFFVFTKMTVDFCILIVNLAFVHIFFFLKNAVDYAFNLNQIFSNHFLSFHMFPFLSAISVPFRSNQI